MIDFDEYTRVYTNFENCLKTLEKIMRMCMVMSNNEATRIANLIMNCMNNIEENNRIAKKKINN